MRTKLMIPGLLVLTLMLPGVYSGQVSAQEPSLKKPMEEVKTAHLFVGSTPLIEPVENTKKESKEKTPLKSPETKSVSSQAPAQPQTEQSQTEQSQTEQSQTEQVSPDQPTESQWQEPVYEVPAEQPQTEPEWTEQSQTEQSQTEPTAAQEWSGQKLNRTIGTISGPSGKESYYNLNMNLVVSNAHNAGIEGDYWVREDGVKMLGSYVLAACDVSGAVHNRYDIVSTSLGDAICADTGLFAEQNPYQIDIAAAW